MKVWKISGVLAKKPSASGWPGGAGEDLAEAGFPPPVILEPAPQRSWGTSAEGREGGGGGRGKGSSRTSAVWLVPPRQGSSCGPREHHASVCLLTTLQGPWPSRRMISMTVGPQGGVFERPDGEEQGLQSQMAGCES